MVLNLSLIIAPILVYVALIVTELYVLKKEIKYYGIVIPVLSFLFSIILCKNLALIIIITKNIYLLGYILFNIPTLILVGLYIMKRKKVRVIK
ncbi:MAG: hypothetical protein Q4G58_14040 [bacterium]|nr:hypothetical protein [bacterium]